MSGKKAEKKHEEKKKKCACSDKDRKLNEITSTLQRIQAEFENYKKRIETEKAGFIKKASKEIILKMLTIVDNFELALKNKENKDEFVKGMDLIYSQITKMLSDENVRVIETRDKKFDPFLHEAMMSEESEKEKGSILEEFQKGYTLNDAVIRHSKVKVAK